MAIEAVKAAFLVSGKTILFFKFLLRRIEY